MVGGNRFQLRILIRNLRGSEADPPPAEVNSSGAPSHLRFALFLSAPLTFPLLKDAHPALAPLARQLALFVRKVVGNPLQLQQVLRNLIGNAIKYTPAEGSITVETEVKDKLAWISVADTGLGIPEEDIPFIFDKFYRVESEDRDDIQGNGLGLAIVKSIVEQHRGKITLKSKVGAGSTFKFSLPLVI